MKEGQPQMMTKQGEAHKNTQGVKCRAHLLRLWMQYISDRQQWLQWGHLLRDLATVTTECKGKSKSRLNLKQTESGQDSSRKRNEGLDVVPEYSSTRKNGRNKTVFNELHARSIEESGDHSARSEKIDLTPARYIYLKVGSYLQKRSPRKAQ